MPRHRKYHNKEERKEANRANNKRFYERKKLEINARRRAKYNSTKCRPTGQGEQRIGPSAPQSSRISAQASVAPRDPARVKIDLALERVRVIGKRAQRILGDHAFAFYQKVYDNAVAGKAIEVLESHIARFNRLSDKISRHRATVLDIAGVSAEYNEVGDVWKRVDGVVLMLEDIYAYALEGLDVLQTKFGQAELKFQSLKGRE